jgi:hypothetical protein
MHNLRSWGTVRHTNYRVCPMDAFLDKVPRLRRPCWAGCPRGLPVVDMSPHNHTQPNLDRPRSCYGGSLPGRYQPRPPAPSRNAWAAQSVSALRQGEAAAGLPGLGVTTLPDAAPDLGCSDRAPRFGALAHRPGRHDAAYLLDLTVFDGVDQSLMVSICC